MPLNEEDFKNLDTFDNENEETDSELEIEILDEDDEDDDDEDEEQDEDERCFLNPEDVVEEAFEPLGIVVQSGNTTVEFWKDPNDNQLTATVKHDGYSANEPGATYRVDAIPMRLGLAVYRHQRKLKHNLEPDLDSAVYNWLNESDQDDWLVIRRNGKPV